MLNKTPLERYQEQVSIHTATLSKYNKRGIIFGWLRFITIISAFASLWWLWTNGFFAFIFLPIILLILFFYILSKDVNNKEAIKNLLRLVQINKTEIEVLHHRFTHLPDGSLYKPGLHEYANDLDIFGRASLFQYTNRTNSEQGNKLFSEWMLDPAPPTIILQRQEAVKELTQDVQWRQQLQSYGKETPVTISMQQKIESWLQQPTQFIYKKKWQLLRFILPGISFSFLLLHLTGIIPSPFFYALIFLQLIISLGISKMVMPAYLQLNKIASELASLSGSISWIEKKTFNSNLLKEIKNKYDTGETPSSAKITKLRKILDMLDIRLNPLVFIPLNTFFFWDLQQIFSLEKWKTTNKKSIDDWFTALAEMECLSSMATLSFNNPEWIFPGISTSEGIFSAEELGHPLIPKDKLINNSFSTEGLNQMNLITGSNMAGKSTFLRSIGVNIVLAMMGSPVCAKRLTVSPMKIMSSMRVSDNLEESTSTFYAELKKLKEIIDAVYENKKAFLLLDEILRGTNSADRHTGSKALIKQLIQHKAAGLIATHDLELAKLADEFPGSIHNYHFDVQVANDELYFDYKLKRGVCQSMNASILMKKIGIEL
ncbi:MAG: hypothetical protein IPF69_13525 [Chitinophagaceae bacterium]|nr:hypothetical protein [Chitinophagaceae bacterium]